MTEETQQRLARLRRLIYWVLDDPENNEGEYVHHKSTALDILGEMYPDVNQKGLESIWDFAVALSDTHEATR